MSHSICKFVTGLIMLFVTLPLSGQQLSDGSDNVAQNMAKTQVENIVKVFPIEYADASELKSVVDSLFRETTDNNSHGLLQMRLGVDERTNSIVASGSVNDLKVVEDLLARLDKRTKTSVYRLQNAAVADVVDAINRWLIERAKQDGQGNLDEDTAKSEFFEKRSCILVPEIVSNSLIVSTSFNEERAAELEQVIRALDTRPDMVKIKVVLKKTVDGIETVISRPHLMTLDQQTGRLTLGSGLESYTIEMTPYIIRNDKPVEVMNIPAQSKDR